MGKRAAAASVVSVLVALTACSSSGHPKVAPTTTTALATTTTAAPTASTTPTTRRTTTTAAVIDASIKVYGDCKTPTVEPAMIVLACADLGDYVSGVSWTGWTANSATGNGTWNHKECVPNCAQGHVSTFAAHVTLTNPVRDPNGQLVWSQLQSSRLPAGETNPQSLPTQPD
jgi:hypothetical protein